MHMEQPLPSLPPGSGSGFGPRAVICSSRAALTPGVGRSAVARQINESGATAGGQQSDCPAMDRPF